MNFEMKFYHTPAERVIKVLSDRYLDDVPENVEIPFQFNTPIFFNYRRHIIGLVKHVVTIEFFRRDPYLVLRLDVSTKPLRLIFFGILVLLALISWLAAGNVLYVAPSAFPFLIWYTVLYFELSAVFEDYCEKLKAEIHLM